VSPLHRIIDIGKVADIQLFRYGVSISCYSNYTYYFALLYVWKQHITFSSPGRGVDQVSTWGGGKSGKGNVWAGLGLGFPNIFNVPFKMM